MKVVSVMMVSYNNESFIKEAIEGVVKQITTFSFELIISDDYSIDTTRDIIQQYAIQYPEIIRILKRDKNIGSLNNFIDTLGYCKGKYIALCDGDDYWTDPLKLQKQVDFLETNPEFSISFHAVKELKGEILSESILDKTIEGGNVFDIYDLADKGNFIHTPSVMYRREENFQLPEWMLISPVGDYVLHMLYAQYGKIKYIPEEMAVYRVGVGIWGKKDQLTILKRWLFLLSLLKLYFSQNKKILENIENQSERIYKQYNNAVIDSYLTHTPIIKTIKKVMALYKKRYIK